MKISNLQPAGEKPDLLSVEIAMTLKVTELSPRIGSQVDIGAEELLSGEHSDKIRTLLEERGVLVFHGVDFDDSQLKAFGETLGTLQSAGRTYQDGIFKVTFDAEHNPFGKQYLDGTLAWHIDRTDLDVPPLGSMLTPRILPPEGGDTEFANTYAAYEDLPEGEKRMLEGLQIVHMNEAQYRDLIPDPTEEQLKNWRHNPPKTHPLVWRHRSGRKSLVLGMTGDHVVGMDRAESDALLDKLMKWSEKPEYVYRHHWQMGDLVVWDNTGTMHRVRPFDQESGRRLHRVTLEGEEPILAT